MRSVKNWASAAALAALAGTAQAALINQGNGTVLDTTTHLVWLQDWSVNGGQTWAMQKAWAENLSFAGSSDWVLPGITEYANLFTAYGDLTSNTLPFVNVQTGRYWSGTEDGPGVVAWYFRPDVGLQRNGDELNGHFAVAVRPADVTAAVPEPQTLLLALLALGAALVARPRCSPAASMPSPTA